MSTEPSAQQNISEAEIALRAHQKWQERGCPLDAHALEDWYAARAELEHERSVATLGQAAPSVTPQSEPADPLQVQLRNLVRTLFDESPRPLARRAASALAALRLRA